MIASIRERSLWALGITTALVALVMLISGMNNDVQAATRLINPAGSPVAAPVIYSRGTHAPAGQVPVALIPEETREVFSSDYPAQFGAILGDQISYLESARMGVEEGVAQATAIHGPVILSGHSQGAVVAGDTAEALHQQGGKPDDEITFNVFSDPRLTGTGAEIVLQKYSSLLAPLTGGQMRGERLMGDIQGVSTCRRGDGICNMEDPAVNPLGTACGLVGYATGYHNYGGNEPTRDVQRGNTLVRIIDAPNPCIPAAENLIGGPVTPEFGEFVEAIAPLSDPGSPELSSPDLGEVAVTAANAAAAGLNIPARVPDLPEVSDLGFDQSYVDNGLAQVEEFANNAAPQLANVVEQAAPIIEQAVEQFTQNAPAQNYTAPVANYDAPAAPAQQITDLATQVAPAAAPVINDAVNALGALGIRF